MGNKACRVDQEEYIQQGFQVGPCQDEGLQTLGCSATDGMSGITAGEGGRMQPRAQETEEGSILAEPTAENLIRGLNLPCESRVTPKWHGLI